MAQMIGMNVDEVKALATLLQAKAGEIGTIEATLTTKLGATTWIGNDATNFRGDWDSALKTALTNVKSALEQASQKANSNAQEQEAASGQ